MSHTEISCTKSAFFVRHMDFLFTYDSMVPLILIPESMILSSFDTGHERPSPYTVNGPIMYILYIKTLPYLYIFCRSSLLMIFKPYLYIFCISSLLMIFKSYLYIFCRSSLLMIFKPYLYIFRISSLLMIFKPYLYIFCIS